MTDIGYTGHRQDNLGWENTGLIYMGARYYEPALRRFVSADTIVPEANNSMAYNRYAYVYNNPVNMVDPTGHCAQDDDECWEWADRLWQEYGWRIDLTGITWTTEELVKLWNAGTLIENWLRNNGGGDARGRLRALFGGTLFSRVKKSTWATILFFTEVPNNNHVVGQTIFLLESFSVKTLIHELGHVLDNTLSNTILAGSAAIWGGGPGDDMARAIGADPGQCIVRAQCSWESIVRAANGEENPEYYGRTQGPSEDFADAFALSVLGGGGLRTAPIRAQFFLDLALQQVQVHPTFSGSPYSQYQYRYVQPPPVAAPTPP